MPRLAAFYGISIYLYFYDDHPHHTPHFHAEYGDESAVFSIPEGEMIAGDLPRKQRRLVEAWARLREEELEQAWVLAVNGTHPGTIEPLTK